MRKCIQANKDSPGVLESCLTPSSLSRSSVGTTWGYLVYCVLLISHQNKISKFCQHSVALAVVTEYFQSTLCVCFSAKTFENHSEELAV